MADATPVNPEVKATKAGKNSNGVTPEVLAEIKAQAKEEVLAEMSGPSTTVHAESPYKHPDGVELVSHAAVRRDH